MVSGIAACLAAVLVAAPATTVKEHVQAADAARRAGDFEAAVQHLEAAYAIAPSPELLNNVGRMLEELGRYADAVATYRKVADDPRAPANLRALDAARLSALAPKLERSWIVVRAEPAAEVVVSGARAALGVEAPGEAGRAAVELRFADGEVRLRFVAAPAGRRTLLTERGGPSAADGGLALDLPGLDGLEVDGVKLQLLAGAKRLVLGAGAHRLRLSAGPRSGVVEVEVTEGARLSLARLAPPPPPPKIVPPAVVAAPPPPPPVEPSLRTYLLGGGGLLAGATGVAFGVLAQGAVDVSPVDPRYPGRVDAASGHALAANVAFGVAAAALVGAGVSLIIDLTEEEGP